MDLPPDPYLALGVPKDATQAAVKSAHRKLVLKCHPDKVADPDAKQAAADQFHKIQTAYEILIDEDRRGRYDAQVRLAGLRKEAMDRPGAGASRSASTPYKSSHEAGARPAYASRASERMAPQYEERRPSYAAQTDYFDVKPRSSPARKEPEYERPSKRSEPKEKSRPSTRDTKESERERRREKTRKTDRDTRKERESKYSSYVAEESESDSDDYARRSRRMREEDDMRKAKDAYYEDPYRHRKESTAEPYDAYKSKLSDARDYIESRRTRPRDHPMEEAPRSRPRMDEERRPSAARMSSTKDKVEYVKGRDRDGRPAMVVRRTSERPKSKEAEPIRPEYSHHHASSRQEPERRSSAEKLADRRPPPLNTSKSSPTDIRIPNMDKPRAQSVQVEPSVEHSRTSPLKRSETMPYASSTIPAKSSGLRQTEFPEGLATPATTPDNANPPANKYNYGRSYADDAEYPTPDGYRTEVREPGSKSRPSVAKRVTRSPSPIKETREQVREPAREVREPVRERDDRPPYVSNRDLRGDRPRTSSARYPSQPQPMMPPRTTSYVYPGGGRGVEAYEPSSRPSLSREQSSRTEALRGEGGRGESLYGEVPTSRTAQSPRHRADEGGINYRKPYEDVRMQSGYSTKRPSTVERPSFGRSSSGYGVKA